MLKFTCCDAVRQFSENSQAKALRGIVRGLERECLRIDRESRIAQTPHPISLGSKLTHPWITTDYAEALLEFITPPSNDSAYPLSFLRDIHRFTAQNLSNEMMWAGSMPCRLGLDSDIKIANYGSSNAARFKHVYRQGLGLRYGRQMQTIAGAHFNWSLPEEFWYQMQDLCGEPGPIQSFVSERYFGLIRNFLRYGWIIPYLFGASPAFDRTFLRDRKTDLKSLGQDTLWGPHATSLRMSDLGYQNSAQANLRISFNSLEAYTQDLETALHTPDPFYRSIGVQEDGQWKQLNANLLQIENEFYAGIRPKRIGLKGERPAVALRQSGVQYIEVRLFDLNPMVDIGITAEQCSFADIFLLMCLFRESPPITSREQGENNENKSRVVERGRLPGLNLIVHNREQGLRSLAHELFDDMATFANMLDSANETKIYSQSMKELEERIDHPELTPSAQVLEAVHTHGSFIEFGQAMSAHHHELWIDQSITSNTHKSLKDSIAPSLLTQIEIEGQDKISFEDYLKQYYKT